MATKIKDLLAYPKLYAEAMRRNENDDGDRDPHEEEISLAFVWRDSPQGELFWEHVNDGDLGKAEALHPELFSSALNDVTPEQWDETYAKLNPMKSTTNSEDEQYYKDLPDIDSLSVEEQQEYREWSDSVDVKDTLDARGRRYGEFQSHASITQQLKFLMHSTDNWEELTPSMKESLEMIAHKIGRILNGDPAYADSWHDIAGYATLVDKELQGEIV